MIFDQKITRSYYDLNKEYERLGSWVGVWKMYRDVPDAVHPNDLQALIVGVLDEVVDTLNGV